MPQTIYLILFWMSDNQETHEDTVQETRHRVSDKRKESMSQQLEGTPSKETTVVLLTAEDFKQLADDSPLEIQHEDSLYGVRIGIREAVVKGSGLLEYTAYNVVGEDQHSTFDMERRYSEFNYLRKKLKERWPGVYIPAIPTKQILNKNDSQVTKNRKRFLNDFLHKLGNAPYLFQSEEVQIFLKGEALDIVKVLEKYKKEEIPQLLKKYQQSFQDCTDKADTTEELALIVKFGEFLTATEKTLEELKVQSRNMAEARDKYNKLSVSVFENILPRYEMNTLIECCGVDEQGCIFTSSQLRDLDLEELKKVNPLNPYWLLYDLLKFQQRQSKAMRQTIQQLDDLKQEREDMLKTIEINKEEISQLSQGKTTLRSLITPGTKQEIIAKHTAQNQKLNVHKEYLLDIINIVTIKLSKEIAQFKQAKVRFFHQVINKVFSGEMHCAGVALEYNSRLGEVSQKYIES